MGTMGYRPPLICPISPICSIKIYGAGPIPGNFINLISYVNLQSS